MRRSGFTILELLVVLAIISILSVIGYKAYDNVVTKSKAASIISELNKLKVLQSKAYQVAGHMYQNCGNSSPGNGPSPDKNTFLYTDRECNIISEDRAEEVFADELKKTKFRWDSKNYLRSAAIPAARYRFPIAHTNGARWIIIEGIPGKIAIMIHNNLNGGDNRLSLIDGNKLDHPVAILSSVSGDCLTGQSSSSSGSTSGSEENFVECVGNKYVDNQDGTAGGSSGTTAIDIKQLELKPRVSIAYLISEPITSW